MGRTDPAEWRDAAPIAYTNDITDNAGATDEQMGSGRARTPVRSTAPKGARLVATVGSGAVESGKYPRDGFPAAPPRPAGAIQEAPAVTAVEAVVTARPCSCNTAAARAPSLDRRPATHASSSRRVPETSNLDGMRDRASAPGAVPTLSKTPRNPVFIGEMMIPKGPQRVGKRLEERLPELKTGYTVGLRPRRSLSAATGHAFRGADRCCLIATASAPPGRTPIPRPLAPVPLSAPPIVSRDSGCCA